MNITEFTTVFGYLAMGYGAGFALGFVVGIALAGAMALYGAGGSGCGVVFLVAQIFGLGVVGIYTVIGLISVGNQGRTFAAWSSVGIGISILVLGWFLLKLTLRIMEDGLSWNISGSRRQTYNQANYSSYEDDEDEPSWQSYDGGRFTDPSARPAIDWKQVRNEEQREKQENTTTDSYYDKKSFFGGTYHEGPNGPEWKGGKDHGRPGWW